MIHHIITLSWADVRGYGLAIVLCAGGILAQKIIVNVPIFMSLQHTYWILRILKIHVLNSYLFNKIVNPLGQQEQNFPKVIAIIYMEISSAVTGSGHRFSCLSPRPFLLSVMMYTMKVYLSVPGILPGDCKQVLVKVTGRNMEDLSLAVFLVHPSSTFRYKPVFTLCHTLWLGFFKLKRVQIWNPGKPQWHLSLNSFHSALLWLLQ